jgi:hypothetical protein
MLNALNRAERYRDFAEECRRLAENSFSTQMRNRYCWMAENYSTLAEAEEPRYTSLRRLAASIAPTTVRPRTTLRPLPNSRRRDLGVRAIWIVVQTT